VKCPYFIVVLQFFCCVPTAPPVSGHQRTATAAATARIQCDPGQLRAVPNRCRGCGCWDLIADGQNFTGCRPPRGSFLTGFGCVSA